MPPIEQVTNHHKRRYQREPNYYLALRPLRHVGGVDQAAEAPLDCCLRRKKYQASTSAAKTASAIHDGPALKGASCVVAVGADPPWLAAFCVKSVCPSTVVALIPLLNGGAKRRLRL